MSTNGDLTQITNSYAGENWRDDPLENTPPVRGYVPNQTTGLSHPHPSVFIQEELDARGWTLDQLAVRMGPEPQKNRLVLDMYFIVGPTHTNMLIGNITAKQLGKAFGVSPEFFLNLHRAWTESAVS